MPLATNLFDFTSDTDASAANMEAFEAAIVANDQFLDAKIETEASARSAAEAALEVRIGALEGAQLPPVQNTTELKAINTTGMAGKDKINIFVEDEKSAYWWDEQSVVYESLPDIVAPTTGPGRWNKIIISTAMPTATTGVCTNVLSTSMTLNASLTSLGDATEVTCGFQYKLTTDTAWSFVFASTKTLSAPGDFSADVTGLLQNNNYTFRAVVQGHGLGFGLTLNRTTADFTVPSVITDAAAFGSVKNNIVMNGDLTALGSSITVNVWFEWRKQGSTPWIPTPPSAKTATGAFNSNVTVMDGYTTYEIRAVAQGEQDGPSYGATLTFFVAGDFLIQKANSSTARYGFGAATYNGKIYKGGGSVDGINIDLFELYDIATNVWSTLAPSPTKRYGVGLAAYNGKIYIVGGRNESSSYYFVDLEVYDIASNTWSTLSSMSTGRELLGSPVVYNGKIYVCGGTNYNLGGSQNILEVYDIASNTWSTLAPMSIVRHSHNVGVNSSGIILAVGGATLTAEVYNISTNTWSSKADAPAGSTGSHMVAINNVFYSTFLDSKIYSFNLTNNTWDSSLSNAYASHMVENDLLFGTWLYLVGSHDMRSYLV